MWDEHWETYAPTPSQSGIRSFVSGGIQRRWKFNQADVESAYLHTKLDPKDKLFLRTPKDFERVAKELGWEYEEGDLLQLHSCLYGLIQAGRVWFLEWTNELKILGFVTIPSEPCIMIKSEGGKISEMIIFHVDDDPLRRKRFHLPKIPAKNATKIPFERSRETREVFGFIF